MLGIRASEQTSQGIDAKTRTIMLLYLFGRFAQHCSIVILHNTTVMYYNLCCISRQTMLAALSEPSIQVTTYVQQHIGSDFYFKHCQNIPVILLLNQVFLPCNFYLTNL